MYVAKKITIDLNRPRKEVVHLGQGDSFTRWIELTLLCDGIPYDPTADLDALGIQDGSDSDIIKTVKYIKANGVPGEYEKIPENGTTPAVALMDGETNVYIVRLDEHATDVPGFAEVFVTFYVEDSDSNVHVLHSFPITLDVVQNTTNATDPGSPYYNIHSFYVKPVGGIPATDIAPDARGLSDDAKEALLACFAHVAWASDDGQDYYDALEAALYPAATLVSITADYQQDRPIYDTDDLDAIKVSDDLTVTANYSDGSSVVLDDDDYTLSGTLTVGTSTITATYEGKTATFDVTVTAGGEVVDGAYAIWDAQDYTAGETWTDRINSVSLTPVGSPTKVDGAVYFDGTAKYFNFGARSVPTTPGVVTIQVAFKLADLTKTAFTIVDDKSTSSGIVLSFRPQDGVIRVSAGSYTANWAYTFDTEWHFMTAILGSGNKIMYVDDTLISSQTVAGDIAQGINSSTALRFGAYTSWSGYSNMYLRSLYIYPKTLTDAEIARNYAIEQSLWS